MQRQHRFFIDKFYSRALADAALYLTPCRA
jgi:hypothetical protein